MMLCYVKFKAGLGRFGYSYLGIHNVSASEQNLRLIDFLPSNDKYFGLNFL